MAMRGRRVFQTMHHHAAEADWINLPPLTVPTHPSHPTAAPRTPGSTPHSSDSITTHPRKHTLLIR